MNNRYRKVHLKAAAAWLMLGQAAVHGQLDTGDLLIADAGNDRVLQFDASAATVSEVVSQAALTSANSGISPSLSGAVFYDSYQAYLYLSGTAGGERLYQADIGTGVGSLANQVQLLGLQSVPEASVELTGKATSLADEILVADRGVTAGSIYRIDLISGAKTLLATEQDYIDFSGSSGIGMTGLDFTALAYNSGAAEYLLLSGGNGQDGSANTRSVLYKTGTDGQPLDEFAVSAIDADWQAMAQTVSGTVYVKQDLSGSTSIMAIDAVGTVTELINQAGLDTIFGGPVTLAPSLALDTVDRLYLMELGGTVYRVDPSNPLGVNSLIVAAQDYIDDTGTAVSNALGLDFVPAAPVSYTVTESSDPSGYVTNSSTPVIENRPYTVSNPNIVQGNFRLGFWTLNGVRQASVSGRGLLRPTFTVTEDTDAVAQYYDVNIDGDGDRLGDWWEYWMFGDRSRGPQDDDDLDGFDHETEFNNGYDATVTDTARPGGVAGRQSVVIKFNDSNKFLLTTQSDPFGLIAATEDYYDPGTVFTSALFSFDTLYTGHYFTHWTVNGTRSADPTGLARRQVNFNISADTDLVAHFTLGTEDTDSDGILDYKELRIASDIALVSPASDLDGDGYTVAEELANGYSPNLDDSIQAGGIAARQSALITFADGKSLYTEDSLPLGIIPSVSEFVDDGTVKTTAYYGPSPVSGLEFAYWSVNGTSVRDPSGIPLREITTTVVGRTDVKAHFFSPTQDNDADGIDDVDEWRYFGGLSNDRTSNPDGDAFNIGEELDNGYSPTTDDLVRAGGVAARQSVVVTFNDSNKVLLTTRSEPFGLIPFTESYYDSGTEIISAHYSFSQLISSHYFTHWTVNGVRVEDHNGISRRQAIFNITADTELVAHFTLSTADTDSDGILDYQELRIVDDPTLATVSPGSDLDGDGFTVAEEQANGFSEILDDTIQAGGVAARMSILTSVNLESAPSDINLTNTTIFEGRPIGTLVGTFVTSANNPNDTFTYSLVPGLGSDDNARFTIEGDELKASEVLDYATDSILNIRVEVTDSASNTLEKAFLIYVLEDLINTYEEFVAETFTPAEQMDPLVSGPDVDIEGDELTNFEEYTHAKNPFLGNGQQLRLTFAGFGTPSTVRAVELGFPWRDGMSDATYSVERSLDLTGWTTVPFSILNEIIINGIRQVTLQVVQLPPHPDKEFFRLVSDSLATQPAVVAMDAGADHTLFLKADGTVWSVGLNTTGQLGDGTTISRDTPVQVMSGVVEIAAGSFFSLFLMENGTVWASGSNQYGQFGDGTTATTVTTPVQVQTNVIGMDAGTDHSLFLKDDFTAWAAGIDNWGQLGDGSSGPADFSPTATQVMTNVRDISAQGYFSFFIKDDDTLWATGRNLHGQFGNGGTTSLSAPAQVATDVASVAGGNDHSLVLKNSGTVVASGKNDVGQLGDGTNFQQVSPVAVMTGVVAVSAGVDSSFLIKDDGELWASGLNDFGQIGDGTTSNRSSFVKILGDATHAVGGASHTHVLESNATIWASGLNDAGQLGDGTNIDTSFLIEIPSLSTTP